MRKKYKETIEELRRDIQANKYSVDLVWEKIVECDVCGCLVLKGNAAQGESIIRKREYPPTATTVNWLPSRIYNPDGTKGPVLEEYIYHPYYCKIHDPNRSVSNLAKPPRGGIK